MSAPAPPPSNGNPRRLSPRQERVITVVLSLTAGFLTLMVVNPDGALRIVNGIGRALFLLPTPEPAQLSIDCEQGTRRSSSGNSHWCNRMMLFGPRHGPFRRWNEHQEVTESSHYVDGKLHGPRTLNDYTRRTSEEQMYDQGLRTGVWRLYYTSVSVSLERVLREETTYVADAKTGAWRSFASRSPSEPEQLEAEGEFLKGKRVGRWTLYQGTELSEEWMYDEESRKHGPHTLWYLSHQTPMKQRSLQSRTTFSRDKEVRKEEWFPNGQQHKDNAFTESGSFVAATRWRENGQKEWETLPVPAEEGSGRGPRFVMREWHDNGQLAAEAYSGNASWDSKDGPSSTWYRNGNLQARSTYDRSLQEGLATTWHENGHKASEGNMLHGKPVGHWRWWSPRGKLEREADL